MDKNVLGNSIQLFIVTHINTYTVKFTSACESKNITITKITKNTENPKTTQAYNNEQINSMRTICRETITVTKLQTSKTN